MLKSLSLNIDCITYDLEDSVTLTKKPEARTNICQFLNRDRPSNIKETAVRINSIESGLAEEDLNSVLKAPDLDALVIPKVNSASDLQFVTDVLRRQLPERHPTSPGPESQTSPIKLLALIESAKALTDLSSICKASPYLSGLIFAAEDFALDLSLTRTPSLTEFLFARSSIVTAARAHNLPSTIDLVCTSYKGDDGLKVLEEECIGGKGLGFNGKQCIHPNQVDVAQRAFAPGDAEVEWAVRIVIADEKADQHGRGAWTLDGKMIDAPVVGKAKGTLRKVEACGINLIALMEKWKGQEPE